MKCYYKYLIFCLICTSVIVFITPQNAYCDETHVWTVNQLKNVIYKMAMNNNANNSSRYITNINNKEKQLQNIVNIMNSYRYIYIGSDSNQVLYIKISNTNVRQWYKSRNQAILNTSYDSWYKNYSIYDLNSSSGMKIDDDGRDTGSLYELNNYRYTSKNVYTANTGGSLVWSAGSYNPSNFFDEWHWKDQYFSYNYISSLNDIIVDEDFATMKQISKSDIASYLAEFGLYTILDLNTYKPRYTIYKYMKPQNYFEPIITYDYNNYEKVNDSLGRIYLTNNMLIPNTIIEINLFPTNLEDFSPLSILFYVTDSNTIVTTDSTTGKPKLDEDNTFDDDYYTRYTNIINNILNENKGNITSPSGDITGSIDFTPVINGFNGINNTLTDDSEVDNIISNQLSGDYESIAEDIGYHVWDNPFFTFLLNIFEDFYDALTKREDIVIDLSVHNVPLVLNTRDFTTPPSILKDVIKWCMVFFYIYFNYKYFYHLITLLQTFKISSTISKIGIDEFSDSNYM